MVSTGVPGVTVMVALLATPPDVAVIVEVPIAKALTMPVVVIVATAVFDELHVTLDEISRVVPSA
jgi:hypothetical protein